MANTFNTPSSFAIALTPQQVTELKQQFEQAEEIEELGSLWLLCSTDPAVKEWFESSPPEFSEKDVEMTGPPPTPDIVWTGPIYTLGRMQTVDDEAMDAMGFFSPNGQSEEK